MTYSDRAELRTQRDRKNALLAECIEYQGEQAAGHTLDHALRPADSGCRCDMSMIRRCVLCGRNLSAVRRHVDTCGERCFKTLCAMQ